jgi:hypothetical protein
MAFWLVSLTVLPRRLDMSKAPPIEPIDLPLAELSRLVRCRALEAERETVSRVGKGNPLRCELGEAMSLGVSMEYREEADMALG